MDIEYEYEDVVGWDSCEMDWANPDPTNVVYWWAIQKAILERSEVILGELSNVAAPYFEDLNVPSSYEDIDVSGFGGTTGSMFDVVFRRGEPLNSENVLSVATAIDGLSQNFRYFGYLTEHGVKFDEIGRFCYPSQWSGDKKELIPTIKGMRKYRILNIPRERIFGYSEEFKDWMKLAKEMLNEMHIKKVNYLKYRCRMDEFEMYGPYSDGEIKEGDGSTEWNDNGHMKRNDYDHTAYYSAVASVSRLFARMREDYSSGPGWYSEDDRGWVITPYNLNQIDISVSGYVEVEDGVNSRYSISGITVMRYLDSWDEREVGEVGVPRWDVYAMSASVNSERDVLEFGKYSRAYEPICVRWARLDDSEMKVSEVYGVVRSTLVAAQSMEGEFTTDPSSFYDIRLEDAEKESMAREVMNASYNEALSKVSEEEQKSDPDSVVGISRSATTYFEVYGDFNGSFLFKG
jgi:hypothetical protein